MSDLLEKMYRDEQDTDSKFVAAASFFMGLKEKTAVAPPPTKKVRVKSLSTDKPSPAAATRQNTKRLIAKGSGKSISLTMPGKISGQSAVRDSRSFKKTTLRATKVPTSSTKKLVAVRKPKVKVVIASAMTQHLLKEAYILQGAKALIARGASKSKKVTDSVKNIIKEKKEAVKPFVDGASTDGKSLLRTKVEGAFKNLGKARQYRRGDMGALAMNGLGINKAILKTRRAGRNFADNFRSADRVGFRRAGSDSFKQWKVNNPPVSKFDDAGAVTDGWKTWNAARSKAKADAFKNLKSFDSGRAAENALGVNATGQSVLKSIKGADGKISTKSVLKGAEDMGLFDPSTLATLGMGAVQSMKAGKAARAAAQADRNKKLLLGGAAGVGAIALMKNSGKRNPPSNYS